MTGAPSPDEGDLPHHALLQARDHAAWSTLYCALEPRVRSFLLRRVGADAADDAVAETMTRALSGIDRYRPGPAGVAGWVFGIARHVASDHHRRAGRHERAMRSLSVREPPGSEPGDEILNLDERSELAEAFGRMTAKDRELLELRVVAGLSAEATASVLGKRPGAVRTAQSRALAKLRQHLADIAAASPAQGHRSP